VERGDARRSLTIVTATQSVAHLFNRMAASQLA
jgi:hypothetical protein